MPITNLGHFETFSLSILNAKGEADPNLEPKLSSTLLRKMFEEMLLTRGFDQRAISLQRQGRIGSYAPATGQEAIHVASATALQTKDWVLPSFREQGVLLSRGVPIRTLFLFFMGTEEGNRFARQLHTLPYCVPCATQVLHAVGIGMAAKIKKDPIVVASFFGDGATSEGDFHEGLNFAGVFQTPTLFICQNNQWAISTPLASQSHSKTLAQKAIAYGFEGIQVDGNDILAIYQATHQAAERARQGQGPTLIECLTYRIGVHTTSDDPARYRSEREVEPWKQKDPIDRFETYLLEKKILAPGERVALAANIDEKLKVAAQEAEALCQDLNPNDIFTYMYATLPSFLKEQMEKKNG